MMMTAPRSARDEERQMTLDILRAARRPQFCELVAVAAE